jgi:hypothetical protein
MSIGTTSAAGPSAGGPGHGAPGCLPRGRRAWSPPVLPADTPVKRRAGRLLPRGWRAVAYFTAVAGLLGLSQLLPGPAYLVVDAVAFLAGGSWCAVNFWRCRQAHCLFTGSGGLLLGLFAAAEAGLGHSLIGGDEQLVFLGPWPSAWSSKASGTWCTAAAPCPRPGVSRRR